MRKRVGIGLFILSFLVGSIVENVSKGSEEAVLKKYKNFIKEINEELTSIISTQQQILSKLDTAFVRVRATRRRR